MLDSNAEIEKIIQENNRRRDSLKGWVYDLLALEGKYCSKSKIRNLRVKLKNEIKLGGNEDRILRIYDDFLWENKFFGYKLNLFQLKVINEHISSILNEDFEYLNNILKGTKGSNLVEDFRKNISDEVSKQFTLVGIIGSISVLMKKVTGGLVTNDKMIFVINLILLTIVFVMVFHKMINNINFNRIFWVVIFSCFTILLFLNIYIYSPRNTPDVAGLFFLAGIFALYISIAFNSLISFHEKNNKHISFKRIMVLVVLVLSIEVLFFASLLG